MKARETFRSSEVGGITPYAMKTLEMRASDALSPPSGTRTRTAIFFGFQLPYRILQSFNLLDEDTTSGLCKNCTVPGRGVIICTSMIPIPLRIYIYVYTVLYIKTCICMHLRIHVLSNLRGCLSL